MIQIICYRCCYALKGNYFLSNIKDLFTCKDGSLCDHRNNQGHCRLDNTHQHASCSYTSCRRALHGNIRFRSLSGFPHMNYNMARTYRCTTPRHFRSCHIVPVRSAVSCRHHESVFHYYNQTMPRHPEHRCR